MRSNCGCKAGELATASTESQQPRHGPPFDRMRQADCIGLPFSHHRPADRASRQFGLVRPMQPDLVL